MPNNGHRWAEIDLGAVRHNVREILSRLPEGTRLMAVVKSDGYQHGARQVGAAALEAGAWGLAVATLDEAAELVDLCPSKRIVVLSGLLAGDADSAVELGCAIGCSSLKLARELDAAACRFGRLGRDRLPVHVKVDTGMGRFGCSPDEVIDLARWVESAAHLELAGIWTHFASSESDEEFTRHQFALLTGVLDRLGVDPGFRHACNSAAALNYPEMALDAVRIGLGIYGGGAPGLRPALSMRARVVHVKTVTEGETVGYGRIWTAPDTRQVATVSAGYADGVLRARSNRGWVLVRGRRAPVVGRVSMDSLTADVTDIPGVELGDVVTVIGRDGTEEVTAEMVADWSGTAIYEILTSIGNRVVRRYLE